MSHVLQVLSEGWSSFTGMSKEVFNRVVPAIRHPETGKIYTSPRGEDHNDIIAKHEELKSLGDLLSSRKIKSEKWNFNRDSGYYDPHTKEFHQRQFDATELMTPHQRFRKYGSESLVERWIDQPVTSVTDDGPASSLNANQSPQEMAKLMLANNQDKDKPTILRYMQYLLNHSTYKMSPEFRGKVRSAIRIIAK